MTHSIFYFYQFILTNNNRFDFRIDIFYDYHLKEKKNNINSYLLYNSLCLIYISYRKLLPLPFKKILKIPTHQKI